MPSPDGLGRHGGESCRALPAPPHTLLGCAGTAWLVSVCVRLPPQSVSAGCVSPRGCGEQRVCPQAERDPPGRTGSHQGPASLPQPKPSFEQSKKEAQRLSPPGPPAEGLLQSRQEQEAEKQAALNKGTAPGSRVPLQWAPCARQEHPGSCWDPALSPRRGFSLVFGFTPQWASSLPGPSLRRRRRWCRWSAWQGGAPAAWPTGSALG